MVRVCRRGNSGLDDRRVSYLSDGAQGRPSLSGQQIWNSQSGRIPGNVQEVGHWDLGGFYGHSLSLPHQSGFRGRRRFGIPFGPVSQRGRHLSRRAVCRPRPSGGALWPSSDAGGSASDAILGLVHAVRCRDFSSDWRGDSGQSAVSNCAGDGPRFLGESVPEGFDFLRLRSRGTGKPRVQPSIWSSNRATPSASRSACRLRL